MYYTKLSSNLVTSSLWATESLEAKVLWITMLAMRDQKGIVNATIPGLARIAGISIEDCESALERFQSPDKYSRTKDHEGRRIEEIDGGWRLLNAEKYRGVTRNVTCNESNETGNESNEGCNDVTTENGTCNEKKRPMTSAERVRKHREKQRKTTKSVANCNAKCNEISQTETETKTKKTTSSKKKKAPPPSPSVELDRIENPEWRSLLDEWLQYKSERRESYAGVALKRLVTSFLKAIEAHGFQAVHDSMERSMANKWQGWDHGLRDGKKREKYQLLEDF